MPVIVCGQLTAVPLLGQLGVTADGLFVQTADRLSAGCKRTLLKACTLASKRVCFVRTFASFGFKACLLCWDTVL